MENLRKRLKQDANNNSWMNEIESFIFEVILKHINDFIYMMKVESDHSFTYLFVNDVGKEHAKLEADYIGKTFYETHKRKIADHLNEMYSYALEEKKPYSYQDKLQIGEGTYTYGETILTPILDDHSNVIYVIGVTRDVTDRMLEKNLLVESQERYKSLVDHNVDAIFSLDLEGVIRSVNPSAETMIGVMNNLQGESVFTLFNVQFQAGLKKAYNQSINGIAIEGEEVTHLGEKQLHIYFKTVPIITNQKVSGIFLILRDITDKARQAAIIEHMAYHDPLTHLLNRSALKRDLQKFLAISKEKNQPLAVMYMDLDRFKMLNDTLGHNSGDKILVDVGVKLKQINHPSYYVYRHGGDEFIIIFLNTNRKEAEDIAEYLIKRFKEPFYIEDIVYYMSLSIGISMFPEDSQEEQQLITNADKALYVVKQRSRANYQLYDVGMEDNTNELIVIETALRRAVEQNELILYYQPQVDLATGKVVSHEALLRWINPELGRISPGQFIPIAEDSGLIIPIGEWVIEEVCKQLCTWRESGVEDTVIAINLSAKQFQQPHLVEMITSLFSTYKINPSQIEFEITEGALQNAEEALILINRLKKLGVTISVDDFGTGFSSLMYLKQFPIDSLKIDQAFIRDVLNDKKDEAIVTTILHLAHHLNLSVVAEGIETDEQLEFLSNLNCQKGQGFLFSKPVPPDKMNLDR